MVLILAKGRCERDVVHNAFVRLIHVEYFAWHGLVDFETYTAEQHTRRFAEQERIPLQNLVKDQTANEKMISRQPEVVQYERHCTRRG